MLECRKWLSARVIAGVLLALSSVAAFAQAAPMPAANPNPTPVGDGTFLLTIFLNKCAAILLLSGLQGEEG